MFDGFPIENLWVDVEESGLTQFDVDQVLELADAYLGRKAGVYSGLWFFANQGWLGLTKWSDRPLWDSNYTGIAEVGSGFRPYGGWTWPVMTQFAGTSQVGSVHQVDLNVAAA